MIPSKLLVAFGSLLLSLTVANAWTTTAGSSLQQRQRHRLATHLHMAATTSETSDKPLPGSIVTIECRLEPEGEFVPEPLIDGVVLHPDDPPVKLTFCLGQGNYLPGLHDLVADLEPGKSIEKVSLDAGWGARNPDMIVESTFESSGLDPSQISLGTELFLANGAKCIVSAVTDTSFTIDANPPLAGASYIASCKLLNVEAGPSMTEYQEATSTDSTSRYQVATFALGCFWGGELEYMREPGVVGTSVGYTQGPEVEPSYEQVCSGTTGHTESIGVTYDPNVVSYDRLVHLALDRLGENKYLLNQVGNDKGTQYRHGVYYHNAEQKEVAEAIFKSYGEDCVTECLPANKYYIAEAYHQQVSCLANERKRPAITRTHTSLIPNKVLAQGWPEC